MTNDKVIWNIQKLKHHLMDENYDVEALFTLDVAIEALKDEQSYQQTIYKLTETIKEKDKREQWIPCSEKMPDKKDVYLITVSDKATNRTLVCEGGYLGENEWLMPDEDCYRLIAWKPMPEPYKEPQNED